jgi:hypothetical protein
MRSVKKSLCLEQKMVLNQGFFAMFKNLFWAVVLVLGVFWTLTTTTHAASMMISGTLYQAD